MEFKRHHFQRTISRDTQFGQLNFGNTVIWVVSFGVSAAISFRVEHKCRITELIFLKVAPFFLGVTLQSTQTGEPFYVQCDLVLHLLKAFQKDFPFGPYD